MELFSQEDSPTLNRYLQKINIKFDDEELSSIILDKEIVGFIRNRKIITDDGLPVVDILGLIALKSHAYFQNLKLYNEKKIKGKENYAKHKNDIIRLLLSLNGNETPIEIPTIIKQDCLSFVDVLKAANTEFKNIGKGTNLQLEQLVDLYDKIFCL